MPTNDQNGIGATPTPTNNTNTSIPQDISDLGDILMEKSMDKTQSSDFVGVKSSDVEQLSTNSIISSIGDTSTEDGSVEPTEGMGTNIGQAQSAIADTIVETPVVNPAFDLGDITLDNSAATPAVSQEPVVAEAPIDLTALEGLSIPESAPVSPNTEIVAEPAVIDTPSQETVSEVIPEIAVNEIENPEAAKETQVEAVPEVVAPEVVSNELPEVTSMPEITLDIPQATNNEVVSNVPEVAVVETMPTTDSINTVEAPVETQATNPDILGDITSPVVNDVEPVEVVPVIEAVETPAATEEVIEAPTPNTEIIPEVANEMTIVDSMPTPEIVATPEAIPTTETTSEIVSNDVAPLDILGDINLDIPTTTETSKPMFNVDIPTETSNTTANPIEANNINDIVLPDVVATPINQEPIVQEKSPEVTTITNNQATQGVDLDSLMSETQSTNPTTPVTPVPEVAAATSAQATTNTLDPKSNKKQLSIILLLLGVIAAGGLAFFGYKAMYPVGVDGPTTGTIDQDIGTPMIVTEDTMTGDTMDSGNIMSGDSTITDTGTIIDNSGVDQNTGTTNITPTISYDALIQSGNDLLTRARKLLIRATIDKNGPARITAFGIQKDIEDFQQTLEKNTDISTLGEASKIIAGLTQRLDSLDQKLHGNSNQ